MSRPARLRRPPCRSSPARRDFPWWRCGPPPAGTTALRPIRIGLWDQYGGSMPSGWTRWMFEQFEFPFEVVYPPRLDAGNLNSQFDVLVFVDGGIPRPARAEPPPRHRRRFGTEAPDDIPAEYRDRIGRVTVEKTVPQIKSFLENGGRIIAIGTSIIARRPPRPAGKQPAGGDQCPGPGPADAPGQVLHPRLPARGRGRFDRPVGAGNGKLGHRYVRREPVYEARTGRRSSGESGGSRGMRPTTRSGAGGPSAGDPEGQRGAAQATVGKGTLYLYAPEITFRSQPHGTFKFLFNALYGK